MATKKKNFAINVSVPDEDKAILDKWAKESGVTKANFFVWAIKMFASEMRTLDDLKPDELQAGVSWPVKMLWGLKEGKLTNIEGGKNE